MANQVYANMMEVSCKAGSGKTICAFPDVCMTPPMTPATPPGVPIPYPNTGMASDTTDGSTSVKISGKEVMLKNKSSFSKSSGDEAGSAPKKGVVTSKNMGKVFFNMWSMDVKVEGENVVRHLDITTHNHASMPGNSPPMPHVDEMAVTMSADAPEETCSDDAACTGSPVNPVLGAKVLMGDEDIDFTIDGPLPLQWQRSYRSNNPHTGWFGRGWGSPLELSVQVVLSAADIVDRVELLDASGRALRFPALASGASHRLHGAQLELHRTPEGSYRLTNGEGQSYWFESLGGTRYSLRRITDRTGNAIHLRHALSPEGTGLITVLCSSMQRLDLVFQHGHLKEVIRVSGAAEQLSHETIARYEYSVQGDLSKVYNAAGELVRAFEYTPGRLMSRQFRAGGFVADYAYDGDGAEAKVVRHADNVGRSWTFDYQASCTRVTDREGRVEVYHFDERRRWTGYVDAMGHLWRRGFDRRGQVRAVVDPLERVNETAYDDKGHPVVMREPDGAETNLAWHPEFDLSVAIVDASGGETKYEYDEHGNLIAQTAPDGGTTRFKRDERGLVVAIEDANGGIKRITYNEFGKATSYTDCSGFVTRFFYDHRGWLVASENALGQRTAFQYDAAGRQTARVLADGSTQRYAYDAAGNLLSYTSPSGAVTQYRYTPDGLVSERLDALGQTLRYEYDVARRLVALINERGERYSYAYDAADRLIEERRFDGSVVTYEYDAAGQLSGSVEGPRSAQPIVSRMVRDPVGRLLARTVNGIGVFFEHDEVGRLVVARNEHSEVRFALDPVGRVLHERVQAGTHRHEIRHSYDALGNRLQTILPDGRKLGALYYGSGHTHQINLDGDAIVDMERDALHREVSRTQGRLLSTRSYDVAGRLLGQVARFATPGQADDATPSVGGDQHVIERRYQYDAGGRLKEELDRGRRISYEFDALERLTRAGDERFDFDPAQNLVSPQAGGMVENGRLLVQGDCRYEYDVHGRVVLKRIGSHTVVRFKWDDEHRLIESSQEKHGQLRTTRYVYDALGRRLAKQTEAQEAVWFVWQGNRLLQQNTGATAHTFVYEPGSYVPLAQVASSGRAGGAAQIYYFHCDESGLPRELSDGEGEIIWEARYKGWGRVAHESSKAAPGHADVLTQAVQPLRYQGQYFDEETGLHYNRHRYYDPDTARYVVPDPVGLRGGANPYQYAPNPRQWIDPLGLTGSTTDATGASVTTSDLGIPDKDKFKPKKGISAYSRKSACGPNTAQKASVQGKPCAVPGCGKVCPTMVADHIDPLVVEHYRTGTNDVAKQTSLAAVQPHCPEHSSQQGGQASGFSKCMKGKI